MAEFMVQEKETAIKECQYCKSDIPKDASVCKYCRRTQTSPGRSFKDVIDSKANRIEIINDILPIFQERYQKVKFDFDINYGRIKIKTPFFSKFHKKDIQLSLVKDLKEKGIEAAKPAFLTDDTISVVKFIDSVAEDLAEEAVNKEKEVLVKKTKQTHPLTWFVGIIFIFIIVSYSIGSIISTKNNPYVAQKKEVSIEKVVEKNLIAVTGKTVNWSNHPKTIIGVEKISLTTGVDKGGYVITLKYRVNDNLTMAMMETMIIQNAKEFTKRLYSDPRCLKVKMYILKAYFPLVDKYGNEFLGQVGEFSLIRTVANKINWENMYWNNFKKILQGEGQFWLRLPAR